MKKYILTAAIVLLAGCKNSPVEPVASVDERLQQAQTELSAMNLGRSIELARSVSASAPMNVQAHYIEAQAQSMSGKSSDALHALELALKAGFKDAKALETNPNLEVVRQSPGYMALLAQYGLAPKADVIISATEISAGETSIKEVDGQQVIKAGDLELKLPNDD